MLQEDLTKIAHPALELVPPDAFVACLQIEVRQKFSENVSHYLEVAQAENAILKDAENQVVELAENTLVTVFELDELDYFGKA